MRKLKFTIAASLLIMATSHAQDIQYPTFSSTLKNGMKIIVCEKPGNDYVESEVWYRVGSKDEKPGIRGMAHLFEHMMFRGTKKYPANSVFEEVDKVGGQVNAYTTYDRTVYHEYVPVTALEKMFDLESDRMQNLMVTQEILNTEREVVGQELRNGESNWYGKLIADRYPYLYPKNHPYEVDVIGFLDEITKFTSEQCMEFYNNYYSPNNAFLVIVGNVKHDEVFVLAEKYFGAVTKQLNIKAPTNTPELFGNALKQTEMPLLFPVQIYSYVFPRPAVGSADYFAMTVLTHILFTDANSILNNRLVKKEYLAYAVNITTEEWSLFPNYGVIDVIMNASPGNVKVKKIIREEINKIIADGIPQNLIDAYIKASYNGVVFQNYESENIASSLGIAEYYFNDYKIALNITEEYKKVSQKDLKRVAANYFSEENIQIMNIKPEF
jgi:zinc protease